MRELPNEEKREDINPFEGIRLFEAVDKERFVTHEVGVKGQEGWRFYEYCERTGEFRILGIEEGHNVYIEYDTVTNMGSMNWLIDGQPTHRLNVTGGKGLTIIRRELDFFHEQQTLSKAGVLKYKRDLNDASEILDAVEDRDSVQVADLEEGQWYVISPQDDDMGEKVIFRAPSQSSIVYIENEGIVKIPVSPEASIGGNYVLRREENDARFKNMVEPCDTSHYLSPYSRGFSEDMSDPFVVVVVKEIEDLFQEPDTLHNITNDEVETLSACLVGTFEPSDAVRGINDRKEHAISVALKTLLYSRFTVNEHATIVQAEYASDPDYGWNEDDERRVASVYRDADQKHFEQAIRVMLQRFGKPSFIKAAKKMFVSNFRLLHDLELRGANADFDPHTDASNIDFRDLELTRDTLKKTYPIPLQANHGNNLNIALLAGEKVFWDTLQNIDRQIFKDIAETLIGMEKIQMVRDPNMVLPIAYIKAKFPEIFEMLRPFIPDPDAIDPEEAFSDS